MGRTVREALTRAVPGQSVVYHTGAKLSGCAHVRDVRRLYDAGKVDLVQRRVPEGFDYIAIFRRSPARIGFYNTFSEAGLA